MRPGFALLALLLVAGCTAPGPSDSPASPTPSPEAGFTGGVPVTKCRYANCYEPTIAADPMGRLFVADGTTSPIGVSLDNGTTWTQVPAPPMPAGLQGSQSDVLLQVSPKGRLYWSALVIAQPMGQGFVLEGLQIAWSDDGAKTWLGNVHVSPMTQTVQVLSPDRQWLGFAPDGTVYVTYNQIPSGIWFARSADDGKTWTGWTRVAPLEGRQGGVGQSGPPVVDSSGRVFVPACEGASGRTLVMRSENKGQTWAATGVAGGCSWFPILTVAPDDTVLLAVQPGNVLVSASTDHGVTFGAVKTWGTGATAAAWPIFSSDGGLVVTWFKSGEGAAVLSVARGTVADGNQRESVVATVNGGTASRTPALTDFASSAFLPDGRVATVYVKGNEPYVSIGVA